MSDSNPRQAAAQAKAYWEERLVHGGSRWHGDAHIQDGHGTFQNANPFDPPPVPKGAGGSGGTSVDTASMDLFVSNIEKLIAPVQKAAEVLAPVSVAPGTFYHANQIRGKVSGANGDSGLKSSYVKALDECIRGLIDLHNGVRQLSQQYKTIEDANGMKAKDLQDAMEPVRADFGAAGAAARDGRGTDSQRKSET
jgi:hypothetical protein